MQRINGGGVLLRLGSGENSLIVIFKLMLKDQEDSQ